MLSQRPDPPPVEGQRLEEQALRKTRRRLGHGGRTRQAWMEGIEPETFGRFRVYGRSILSLVGRWKSDTRARRQILDEARLLGNEYASAMAGQGRGLEQTLSAFLFFRHSVLEALPEEARPQAMAITDQVMLGAAAAFEKMARSQPA